MICPHVPKRYGSPSRKRKRFGTVTISICALAISKPQSLKLNPSGVVPTLVHDGEVIIELTVINEYIDDALSGLALRPADARSKARMRLWTKQLDEGLHADTGVLSTSIAFRYQLTGKSNEEIEALINNVPDPVKRERVRANFVEGVNSRYFKGAVRRFDDLLGRMEQTLAASAWLAGNTFSLADIAFAPYLTRLDHLQLSWLWSRRRHVEEWYERVQQRKGYQIGLTQWFNPKYLLLMKEKGQQERQRVEAEVIPT